MTAVAVGSDDPIVRIPLGGIALDAIERAAILAALQSCAWVQADAAKLLRISPRVIHYKIHVHGIALPADHPNVARYAWRRTRTNN